MASGKPPSLRRLSAIGATASASPIAEFALRFLRTVILSHLLAPREFGIAVGIGALLSTVKLAGDLSLEKFVIVRTRDGEAAVAAAHAVGLARGAAMAFVAVIAGPIVARFLGAAGAAGSFQLLALVFLVQPFGHLQVMRMQAEYRYLPELIANVSAQLCAVAAVLPLLRVFGDHRVIIGSLLVEAVVYAAASQVAARTRFRVGGDRRAIREILRFGLPLTVNGLGLAAAAQLDRLVVGHWLGVVALGQYALILTIGIAPISLLGRINGALALPYLANRQHDPIARRQAQLALVRLSAILAAGYALWVAGSLDLLVPGIFGATYRVAPGVHALVAILAWVTIAKFAPIAFLQATGRTGRLAIATLSRALGLAAAVAFLSLQPRLQSVLAGLLFGEVVTLGLLYGFNRQALAGEHRAVIWPAVGSLAVAVTAAVAIWSWPEDAWPAREVLLGVALPLLLVQAGIGYRHWRQAFPAAPAPSAPA